MEKTMEKIVALAKARGFVYPVQKSMVDLLIHGITVTLVLSLRIMLRRPGGRSLCRNPRIMWVWTVRF